VEGSRTIEGIIVTFVSRLKKPKMVFEVRRQPRRGINRDLPKDTHPHEFCNVHLSDVSQCSSHLTENTVGVHYKIQPVKSFRKIIGDKC
jgi:hypothetical protein